MTRWLTSRLQRKLILAFALVIALPTLIIAFYSVDRTGDLLIDMARLERLRSVSTRAAVAERLMTDNSADLLFLSQAPVVRRYANAGPGANRTEALRDIERFFAAFLGRWPDKYADLCLLDNIGMEVACVRNFGGRPQAVPAHEFADQSAQPYFSGALSLTGMPGQQPVYLSDLELRRAGPGSAPLVPTLRHTAALQTDHGAVAGVLALNGLVTPILRSIEPAIDERAEASTTYVVDRQGNYVLHPQPEWRFGNLLGTKHTLQADRPSDGSVILGSRSGTLFASPDRPEHLQAFARIHPPGQGTVAWTVIDELSLDAVLSDVRETRVVIIAVAALALMLATGVAVLLTHGIVRPIRELAAAADAINHGRFDPPLPAARSNDEVGVLTLAFGRMATHVRGLVGDLEQRVADLERTQTALRGNELQLRRMIEANLVGITFADLDGRIVDANDAFLRIVGYTREDLAAGRVLRETITAPECRDVTARALAEIRTNGSCVPYEKEYVRKDGSRVPVLVGAALIEGSTHQVVAFVLDQTERRQSEADRHARYAAEAANRAKSVFLTRMSHELRTPLNAVLGYAQMLQWEKDLSERQRGGLEAIQKSGEHLLQLIVDLLDLSRIEAGRFRLEPSAMQLDGFLGGIGDIVRVKAQQRSLEFTAQFTTATAGSIPRGVLADEARLRQVLLNLLDNAVKFTDRGNVRLHVAAQPAAAGTVMLHFEVSDTGIGIAPGDLERVFQPFEQVGDMKRRVGGTGLGLAISRQIVRLMGGEIRVESEPEQGSRFSFELQLPVLSDTTGEPAVVESLPTAYRGPRRKVLVVDDVAANRALLVELLNLRGFVVCEAENGEEALQRALTERPDLILMDIAMPVLNGLDATRRLRQMPALQNIAVICISAAASEGSRQTSLAAGANDFIAKPVDLGQLLLRVGALLGLQWIEEEPRNESQPDTNGA